uniref:Uncharacterized protein n=1 Tax=Physcomitrium patens TaxID=3218 RepID=A0A2K1INL4_PHYPA|nr:hypothetical protein PHYPA_027180 [Physcomitrium patens]
MGNLQNLSGTLVIHSHSSKSHHLPYNVSLVNRFIVRGVTGIYRSYLLHGKLHRHLKNSSRARASDITERGFLSDSVSERFQLDFTHMRKEMGFGKFLIYVRS